MCGVTPRIFATADIGAEACARLRAHGYSVEVQPGYEPPPKSLIVDKVKSGIAALITTLRDPIDEEVFAAGAGTLKVVAQVAVGVDNIDLAAADRYRIPVTNTPDVLTEATAEFALFMMGAVSRKLRPSERLVEENQWSYWHLFLPFLGDEVTGKTVAVIGAGRIGKAFARKCIGLDMDVLLYSRRSRDDRFLDFADREMQLRYDAGFSRRRHSIRYVSFHEALTEADYVSLHVPRIPQATSEDSTYHLIDADAFELMQRSAYLINTSRGPVVDEQALYEALVANRIEGAALDVFETEPLPNDSPLRDPKLRDRLRLFHHFGSGTKETRLSADPDRGMAGRAVQGVIDVLENRFGGDPSLMPFVVNKKGLNKRR